jgi:hypothetical protein
MKHSKTFLGFLVLLCAAALFLGCPTESDDDDGDGKNYGVGSPQERSVSATTGTPVYFSFTTGAEVTDAAEIASKNWDIAFQPSRMIYTNSGGTAALVSSKGLGGVWYTDKTNFSAVSSTDAVPLSWENTEEYLEFGTDVVKYTGSSTFNRYNIMTYWGFPGGTGTQSDPYTTNPYSPSADFVPYSYNKKNYISMITMTGPNGAEYALSNQVYIIKHGDGIHYSKLQITNYTSVSTGGGMGSPVTETFTFTYQNF